MLKLATAAAILIGAVHGLARAFDQIAACNGGLYPKDWKW